MFIFLLLANSITPILMITIGLLWKNHSPKSINWIYGYRSSMSMKNEETWKFAHMHNAKIWRRGGFIWLIISILLMLFFRGNYEKTSEFVMEAGLVIIFLSLIPTEIALRKKFDKNGNLK